MCQSGDQCIPKSFHCDRQVDCQDQSDEIGCSEPFYIYFFHDFWVVLQTLLFSASPVIIISPPAVVPVNVTFNFTINCTAMGIPTPEIVWRLNWGHVPEKCSMTSTPMEGNRAYGELNCPDAKEADQGAYSCEAISNQGSCFAGSTGCGQPGQDAVVMIDKGGNSQQICPSGSFNALAVNPNQCLTCFCFGITNACSSTELKGRRMALSPSRFTTKEVVMNSRGQVEVTAPSPPVRSQVDTAGITLNFDRPVESVLYLQLPPTGNLITSYGGFLSYDIRRQDTISSSGRKLPDVIVTGNGYNLYNAKPMEPSATSHSIRLWVGDWIKKSVDARGRVIETLATREEIMVTLENVEQLLIRFATSLIVNLKE